MAKISKEYAEIILGTIYDEYADVYLDMVSEGWTPDQQQAFEFAKSHVGDLGGFKAAISASLNGAGDEILSDIDEAQRDRADASGPTFKLLTYWDILNMPPRDMLVSDLIARKELGLIFGESGGGKTFVALDLIASLISGMNFADSSAGFNMAGFSVPRPLAVTYCAGEGQGGIKDRLQAIVDSRRLADSDLARLSVYYEPVQLFADDYMTMQGFLAQHKQLVPSTDVLIIDTLNTSAIGADENSAKDMGKMLSRARMAISALGCAIIIIHHAGKNSSRERGSSALRASCDVMLEVSDNALQCSKLKDGIPFQPIPFIIQSYLDSAVVEWIDPSLASTTKPKSSNSAKILALFTKDDTELSTSAIASALGTSTTSASNSLAKMVDNSELTRRLMDENKPSSRSNGWLYKKIILTNSSP